MNDIEKAILADLQAFPQSWDIDQDDKGQIRAKNSSKRAFVLAWKFQGFVPKARIGTFIEASPEFAAGWWEITQIFFADRDAHARKLKIRREEEALRAAFGLPAVEEAV